MRKHLALLRGMGMSLLLAGGGSWAAEVHGIANPVHNYWTQEPSDRFSVLRKAVGEGRKTIDTESEGKFLSALLGALEVPVSSQMLVFSATSFQTPLISPRNPRAIYFNEDTYVGHVPGGRIEIISIDEQLGGIFYLFDRFQPGQMPRIERSTRCMNCHAPSRSNGVPGLVVESMVPGLSGGGEQSFRTELSGHGIPLTERFGGWHVTGAASDLKHRGNLWMESVGGVRRAHPIGVGELFSLERYLVPTSDLLAHLVHEHQVGFINRALAAGYLYREVGAGRSAGELESAAESLVRYLLFLDEAALPKNGVRGDPGFKTAFLARKKMAPGSGRSLRDFDLSAHLFRYRCSYMIYSNSFTGLPTAFKSRVYALLDEKLATSGELPLGERNAIRAILKETVPDLPAEWGRRPAL